MKKQVFGNQFDAAFDSALAGGFPEHVTAFGAECAAGAGAAFGTSPDSAPAAESAAAAIVELQERIAECLLAIDEINLQINPQIESDYTVKIGCYENELLRCQIDARRARRKLALAQARKNRGESISEPLIEKQLDEEFREWEDELQQQISDYMEQLEIRAGSRYLFPVEAIELKRLHRELIKRLHPDMRSDLGEEGTRFFMIVQAAFKAGDLDTLRSVEVATARFVRDERPEGTPDELAAERELLAAQLSVTEERLEHLKKSLPYALREKLANANWVHARVEGIKRQIEEQKQVRAAYEEQYRLLKNA